MGDLMICLCNVNRLLNGDGCVTMSYQNAGKSVSWRDKCSRRWQMKVVSVLRSQWVNLSLFDWARFVLDWTDVHWGRQLMKCLWRTCGRLYCKAWWWMYRKASITLTDRQVQFEFAMHTASQREYWLCRYMLLCIIGWQMNAFGFVDSVYVYNARSCVCINRVCMLDYHMYVQLDHIISVLHCMTIARYRIIQLQYHTN